MNNIYDLGDIIANQDVTFFCVPYDGKNILSTKVRVLFDLDNDGIIRVANPCDPRHGNMYFSNFSNVRSIPYNVFDTVDEAMEYSDNVLKITMNKNNVVIRNEMICKEVSEVAVRKAQ